MLPDMLVGAFTGKTKSLGLKENLMPLASIVAGAISAVGMPNAAFSALNQSTTGLMLAEPVVYGTMLAMTLSSFVPPEERSLRGPCLLTLMYMPIPHGLKHIRGEFLRLFR